MGVGGGVAAMGLAAAFGKKIYEKIRPNSRKSENDKTEQREEVFDRKKKLQEILEFTDAPYTYTLPISEGESWSSRTPTGKKPGLLVRYEETLIPAKLVYIMSTIMKYKYNIQACEDIEERYGKFVYRPNDTLNRFVCGGPFSNPDTRTLLRKCDPIKFPCLESTYEDEKKKNSDRIEFACPFAKSDKTLTIIYGNDEEKFSYNKGENVIFLARLKGDVDFKCNRGTIHILSGTSTDATVEAVDLLYKHTETLYNMVKEHKGSHYAYLIKVSANNEIDFSSRRDITRSLWS